jgi:hypothetical protein
MEVVREQPPEGQRQHTPECERLVVGAHGPHPLLSAAHAVEAGRCAAGKCVDAFPMLTRVRASSDAYVDEDLWLSPDRVAQLLDQFTRLRRVCQQQEFLSDLDGRKVSAVWRAAQSPAQFETWLDRIDALLWKAVEGNYWVRLML